MDSADLTFFDIWIDFSHAFAWSSSLAPADADDLTPLPPCHLCFCLDTSSSLQATKFPIFFDISRQRVLTQVDLHLEDDEQFIIAGVALFLSNE